MQIDEKLRKAYLESHLPYRINSLLSPDLITHRREKATSKEQVERYSDSLILEPSFEISIVFGRSLLAFLGITIDSGNNLTHITPRKDDFTIKDIYPDANFCPLNDNLVIKNKQSLTTIIRVANKSVAHLTTSFANSAEQESLASARIAIYKLMLKYVPDINKQGIWWYTQVESN